MPDYTTIRFSEGQGLFSAAEISGLMRIEFERAQRHAYPLVCMLIAVDRLGQLHDLYGIESKDEILHSVIGMLRESMRDCDHLGVTQDDHLLAVFPHTTPEAAGLLARRLLASARKLRFDRDGRSLRISLSIGVSHNKAESEASFDTLLHVAEEGLAVADAGGGDRFVETELYQLYEKSRRAQKRGTSQPVVAAGPLPTGPAPKPPSREELFGRALLELLAAQGFDDAALKALSPDAIATALRQFQEQKARAESAQGTDRELEIELLERRIAKLTQVLGVTEEELRRIAAMKGIEFGIASIYRTVQGLAGDAKDAQRKREMMKIIFEANFELMQRRNSGGPGSTPGEARN